MMRVRPFAFLMLSCLLLSSCNFFWGSKKNEVTDEIFEQGRIDPSLIPQNVGYVPVLPFFTGFSNPVEVYAGYDEMVYVVDDFGVHVLDKAGRRFRSINIPGATEVVQDRRLHTYVSGRVNVVISGQSYNLAAVYHLTNTATSDGPYIIDTIVHPFSDVSRKFTSFRGADDQKVVFGGLATLADNTLLIGRRGPVNASGGVAFPDNTILVFDINGNNVGYSNGLSPSTPSIRSSYNIHSVSGFAGPPQRLFGMNTSRDFFITQYDSVNPVEFGVIGIKYFFDPDFGTIYEGRPDLLNFDTSKTDRFLYESFRFGKPEDVYIAPDQNQYIFVVDSRKDSLYQFTPDGFEGVNPPANYPSRKQIIVSFGGEGGGPFQFNDPVSVCYNNKLIYVADKNNGRICRFRLSTDIE